MHAFLSFEDPACPNVSMPRTDPLTGRLPSSPRRPAPMRTVPAFGEVQCCSCAWLIEARHKSSCTSPYLLVSFTITSPSLWSTFTLHSVLVLTLSCLEDLDYPSFSRESTRAFRLMNNTLHAQHPLLVTTSVPYALGFAGRLIKICSRIRILKL